MILSSTGNCSHSLYVYSMISIPIKVGMCGGKMYRYGWVVNHRDSLQSKFATLDQCDQIKIAKFLQKLPKNDFARKMIDFGTFTKIA